MSPEGVTSPNPVGDAIGKSVPRLEAREKLTGQAVYTDDMTLPGMLHAAMLGAPYAHARIRSIDTSEAEALEGVRAVVTAEDLPKKKYVGVFLKDQMTFAGDKVRYISEPIAAVAADTLEIARKALQLIEVEYEELPAVFDPEEALEADAPILHENRDEYPCPYERPEHPNAVAYTQFKEGDIDNAWAECDVIVEGVYETPAQEHMYMEPCSTLVAVDANGKITIWSSMQSVFRVQTMIAEAFDMPMSKVRVIAPRIGGGFGGKCDLTNQPATVALALKSGRPVKMTLSCEDDMMMMKSRHAGKIYCRTGARKDGTLVAREMRLFLDGGAYADESPEVSTVAAFFGRGPYRIPHVNVESWSVYTNKLRASAFRGFGNPQATFASERQIDEVAEKLGMDPIDLRIKNALQSGDKWLGGQTVEGGSLAECLEKARAASDWDKRRQNNGKEVRPGKRRGICVSGMSHISGMLSAGAAVRLHEDGTVTVNTGAVDIGEGADTVMAQICAGALGLSLDQVNYGNPDTDSSPYNFQTSASRVTYMVGKAVEQASERVREQMFRHAGEMLECAEDDLELRPGGVIGIRGVGDAAVPFAAIAGRSLYASGGPIMGTHNWLFEGERFDPKRALVRGFALDGIGVFTFGAHVVEVDVDMATGKTEVLEAWCAHDVGRALNPGAVDGQIHGAFAQGLGYGLYEELVWDDGRLVNPTMMDYKVPGPLDLPYKIHPILIENPSDGPFGAKGIGEIALVGTAPAICNAITAATGAAINRIPATPERVLRAILAAEGGS